MSLYLAKKIPTTQDPPAAFLAKKLGGYTPAPVGSLAILGISKYPEVAYGVYRSNIDAFCAASFSNKKVFAQAEGFGNAYVPKPEVPFSCHPVAFSPSSKLSPDQANLLLKKLGEDSSMKYIGKTLEYTIPHPLPEQLDKLLISSNPNFSVGPDRFTPSGYQAYQKAISLLEMFLGQIWSRCAFFVECPGRGYICYIQTKQKGEGERGSRAAGSTEGNHNPSKAHSYRNEGLAEDH